MVKLDISNRTKRKIFLTDMRSHGRSEWVDDYSIELLSIDLENFMITEKIPKAVLVGHSLGGRAAIALAFRKPEMVEKLVVEDICLQDTEKSVQVSLNNIKALIPLKKAIKYLTPKTTEKEAQKRFQNHFTNALRKILGNLEPQNVLQIFPIYKDKSGNFVWDVNIESITKLAENVKLISLDLSNDPVYHGECLLLGAGKSPLLQESDVEAYCKHIPKCRAHFFKDGFHIPHLEFRDQFVEMVVDFIGK